MNVFLEKGGGRALSSRAIIHVLTEQEDYRLEGTECIFFRHG